MYNYVQVVSGVIVGLQQSTVEVSAPGLFEVETYDPGLVGRLWVDGAPGDLAPVTEPVADAVFLAQKAAAIAALPNSIKFLSAEERGVAASLFAEWQAGMVVTAGEYYRWDGVLYEVVQGHTTQAGWQPPNVPALFAVAG